MAVRLCRFWAPARTCVERPAAVSWQDGYLPSGVELASYLAEPYGYPGEDLDLLRVSQWVDLVSSERRSSTSCTACSAATTGRTSCTASSPSCHGTLREQSRRVCGQLILTTNYDDVLEHAFADADEPVDVVVYETRRSEQRFVHLRPDGERVAIVDAARYREFALEERSVILKIHGDVDRDDVERDTFVITEDNYIDYLAGESVRGLIPAYLMRADSRERHALPRLLDARLEPARDPAADLGGAGRQHGRLVDPARSERDRHAGSGRASGSRSSPSTSGSGSTAMREQLA